MKALIAALVCSLTCLLTSAAFASNGLVIHTTEFGVGKFHRYDNQQHAYGKDNAWLPYVLPVGAATDKALTVHNADGSYTVFFSTLDEMMTSVEAIVQQEGKKISVFNIHGHGLPGAMWFPKDEDEKNGFMCGDWVRAASGEDVDNYNQYYGPVTVDEIEQIRGISNNPNVHMGCTTGAAEWKEIIAKHAAFKAAFDADAQMHFLSCVVGLGSVGAQFTQDIAQTVLANGAGHVETSMAFGLGDWSMPEGMGFWDFQSQQQVDSDNAKYPVDHKDREIAQKGSIRLASFGNGAWSTSALAARDFMKLSFEQNVQVGVATPVLFSAEFGPVPARVRVPGTNAYVDVK